MIAPENFRLGVIGVGAIGKNHARVLSESQEGKLTAIYDTNLEVAQQLADQYGVQAVDDLETFMTLVDAATVATPTITHREIGERLLLAGKHVLIEKPIADRIEDAVALVALSQKQDRILQVGHIERFNPVLSQLEQRIVEPRFIEIHRLSPFPMRSMDVGVVLDVMIHDLEILLHLVRSPVLKIEAVGLPVLTTREDIANARITFENGCIANVTASRISPEKMRKIRLFALSGYLSLDYMAQEAKFYRREGLQIVSEEIEIEKDEPLKLELESFARCARLGLPPRVSGREASAALELAIEITSQIARGFQKNIP